MTPPAPRWLNDDEQATWRAYLAIVRLVDQALDRQLQRDAGMPHAYYMLLAMLSEAPGRSLRMNDLAAVTNSSQSRVSHAVSRLEELGWVRRESAPADRRGSVAVLTDTGYEVLAAAAPGHVEAVRRVLFDPLTPTQVRHLGEICEAVLEAGVNEAADSAVHRRRGMSASSWSED
ncbi:MAG TPA: MarR family transcriptional regulator [Jiangellales bacterium]|nr:MarR family transcriptional regulator [Jiangellales bacterium]